MKIALVSRYANPFVAGSLGGGDGIGQNVFVENLAVELGRHGNQVTIYTRRDSADLPRQMRLAQGVMVEFVSVGPAQSISNDHQASFVGEFARHLKRRWATDPPDIAHAHSWMSGLAALAGSAELNVPVVQTFHALGAVECRHKRKSDIALTRRIKFERHIGHSADAVIATSVDEVSHLIAMGVPRARIGVVPCGVDIEAFRPEGPTYPVGAVSRLVTLSGLVDRKGVDTAIEALGHLPKTELVVAGGPVRAGLDTDPEVHRLRMFAKEVDVADRVRFLGRVGRGDVPSLLRSADLVVTLPWYAPLGLVALEAMACGVPVVASGVGGHLDIVINQVTGVHVPPRRPRQAARTIRALLADPTRRQALGVAGADRAQVRNSWGRIARETTAIYQATRQRARRHAPVR